MPIIDIPEVGQVEFPEGMTDDEISAAADQLYGEAAQGRVSPNPVVNQKIDPSIRLDRNAGLREQQRQAAATGDTAETAANALSWGDFLIRPFASTAENPLGLIGSAARGAGQVINEAGKVGGAVVRDVRLGNSMFSNTAAALSGTDIGPSPGGPVGAGLDAAGQTLPMVAGGMALQAAGVPAPVAFGGPMAASAFEASGGDINTALKAGATGALIPGVAQAGREAAATALGKAVAAGVRTGGNVPEKIAEALAAQGGVQVFMEGMSLPEYVQMTPEQRREALIQNLVANTAFLAMDVPGVMNRSASATSWTKGGQAAQVGAIMEHLVNDPRAMERIRVAVDDVASQALNPRRAWMQFTPPQIQNVEPQFVDPAMEPFRGAELKVEPQVLSLPETIQETLPKEVTDNGQRKIQEEGRQTLLERPAPTIEVPTAPAAETAAGERSKAAPATPAPEPVQQKAAKGTKTPAAMTREGAKDFDRLVLEHGMQAGWVTSPEALYNDAVDVKTGHGTGSIKAKILRQQEMAKARRRAASEIGLPADADLSNPAVRAKAADQLKEWVQSKIVAPQRQIEEFSKATQEGKLVVPVAELKVGETLNIEGEMVKVVEVSPDGEVTLQDGTKFGRQTLADGATIYAEEWHSSKVADQWLEEPPAAGAPKIKSGQTQGDLLGSGDVEFNLFGERGQDGDRIAQEQAAKESAQREAAAFAAKNQQEFGIDTGALGKAGMGGAKPGEFGGFESATSIKNAQVDVERAQRGLPPAIEPLRRSFGTVWDEAMARIDLDPAVQDRLLDELTAKPRAVTDLEDALLLQKQVELQNEYGRATRELAQAYDDAKLFPNRLEMVEMWKARAQAASDQLLALYNINKAVGTETARGLNARKMMAREDYTLEAMEMSKRLANEGAPLSDAQRAELETAQAKIAELQRAHDDYVQRAEEERARRRADDTVREMAAAAAKEPTYDPRIIKIAEEIVQKLEKRAEAARASVREKLARLNAGVDPTLVYELGVIGAAKIARKGLDLTRFTAEMVGEFGEKIRPFIQDVWTSANSYLENEGAKYGDKAEPIRRILRKRDELGRRENIIAGLKKAHAEGQPVDLLGDYVRKLAESFVRAGVNTREPLVDAVHGVLSSEVDPAITRRETMDAISGYGRFKPLNPDAIKAQLRTLKGEMQQLAKLEDIQSRTPLKKTGVERRVVGDEERRLIAQVNEAKRRFGVVVTDPARQLKSALDAITTRLKNSIADLEYQIATGTRTVKTKTPAPTSPEVELLKARRDKLRLELDELLPRPEMTDAQRIQIAARHIERGIAELEQRIANRDVSPAQKHREPPSSPHLDALRAKRAALQAEFAALRDALDPARAERVALSTLKARMEAQTARYLDRLARGDFAPRARKEIPLDEEALRLKAKLQMAKEAWQRGLELDRAKHRTLLHKAGHAVREALNLPRSMLSSWDFSAVLRQGGFVALGHPVRAARALPDMFRAWASPERAAMVDQEILSRPNAPRYVQAKLYLAPLETTHLSTMEEAFMSRLAKSIPGVARSNRAFVTFLNRLRADSFDAFVNRMELGGPKLENAELQAVANYINVATGRGDLGRAAAAAETLATVFFSPRLVTSRFQLLLGQPAWQGTARTRQAVAAEYARFLAGLAVVYGLAKLAGAELEEDPRSSDFGKLKFGNTRVDPLGGLSQATVLISRLVSGSTKTAQGEVKDIRGKVPFGESTSADVVWRFLRSKLAPVPAVALDVASGSNVVGEPVTAGDAAMRLVVPLSFADIYDVMKEQGVLAGTALGMLSVFGFGLQQQPDPDVRLVVGELMKSVRAGTTEEREAIRKAYEEQFSTNSASIKEWADALRLKRQSRQQTVSE